MLSFKNIKIGPKLVALFLCIGILPLMFIAGWANRQASRALEYQIFKELEAIR